MRSSRRCSGAEPVNLFRLNDRAGSGYAYTIEGDRDGSLGGITCDVCGQTWAGTNEAIPSFDVASHPLRDELRTLGAWPAAEWRRIRDAVRPFAPEWALLRPGAGLGRFHGDVRGKVQDLMMDGSRRVVVLSPLLQELLRERELPLPRLVPADLTHVTRKPKDLRGYAEVELPYRLSYDETSFVSVPGVEPCEACGLERRALQQFVLKAGSEMPDDLSMCRARNAPGSIIVTEQCRIAMIACGVDGKMFFPLQVASS